MFTCVGVVTDWNLASHIPYTLLHILNSPSQTPPTTQSLSTLAHSCICLFTPLLSAPFRRFPALLLHSSHPQNPGLQSSTINNNNNLTFGHDFLAGYFTSSENKMAQSNTFEQASTNYKEAFALFDKRGNQRVALESLGDLLRACGQNPTLAEIRDLEKNVGSDCTASPPNSVSTPSASANCLFGSFLELGTHRGVDFQNHGFLLTLARPQLTSRLSPRSSTDQVDSVTLASLKNTAADSKFSTRT